MTKYLFWLFAMFGGGKAFSHPMPNSIVNLSVLEKFIRGEAKIPLIELANAVGDQRITNLQDPFFMAYFTAHITAASGNTNWETHVENIRVVTDTDPIVGTYQEVLVLFTLSPPSGGDLHEFTFKYDAVIHQVVTHSALVYVEQDWENGVHEEQDALQVGIIKLDIPTEKVYPLQINLERGTWWKGFNGMLNLGMQHIKAGTDHLLFLIVLLLPAMLLTNGRTWEGFGGVRYSIRRLLKIVTAFTIGHSITLLAGALGWLRLPGQPVEILIAVSILVSAIHAIRPIFPGKEIYIAAGFGLIHGLAFANVLSKLDLSTSKLALSILGFNLGIEIMQLLVIVMIIPWLILLSKTRAYRWVRITGAVLAATASVSWISERVSGNKNIISNTVVKLSAYATWGVTVLAIFSLAVYLLDRRGTADVAV